MAVMQPVRPLPCPLIPCPWGHTYRPLWSTQTLHIGPACRVTPYQSLCLCDTYSSKCVMLQSLDLSQSTLQGSLPPEWGQLQAFPSLMILNASFTQLTGPLPSAWGTPDAFSKLMNLSLVHTDITGGLPDSWATLGAWPQLVALQVDQTHISGQFSHLSHSMSHLPCVSRMKISMPSNFVFAEASHAQHSYRSSAAMLASKRVWYFDQGCIDTTAS